MGRDKIVPLSEANLRNAADLLARVNYLLGYFNLNKRVTSGYRPIEFNSKIGGSTTSTHMNCTGVDLEDTDSTFKDKIMLNIPLLEDLGLWLESPKFTKTWVHLDMKKRNNRVFVP